MILLPQKDFEKNCLISRTNTNKKTLSHKIIEESLPVILPDSLEEIEENHIINIEEKIEEPLLVALEEPLPVTLEEPLPVALEEKIEEKIIKNNELQEIELDIEDLEEPLVLTDQSVIYLEIYKEARKKAKELRQNALQAYLDAKNIKTKYKLDEFDELDDDDEYDDYILNEYQNEIDDQNESESEYQNDDKNDED